MQTTTNTQDEKQVANEVLVGLAEKLRKINGGDNGALEAIKGTLFETLDEIDAATEDEEQVYGRMALADARAALADEILDSIGRLAALRARLQKMAYIPDADTLYGMAFAMKPIEYHCDMDRRDLAYTILNDQGEGHTFLARAVDDVEAAIGYAEDETSAHLFDEWAKTAEATTEMPAYLKGYLKESMRIVAADVCARLGVPEGTTIAAVAQSRPAVRS